MFAFTSADFATLRNLVVFAALVFCAFQFLHSYRMKTKGRSIAGEPSSAGVHNYGNGLVPGGNAYEVLFYATGLISNGHAYYPDWSAGMSREYDELNQDQLERLFELANSVAAYPKNEWQAEIHQRLAELDSN